MKEALDSKTFEAAKRIWDYLHINDTLEKSDCILVLGSHDLRVAECAAQLWLEGYAPFVIFSGGYGRLTEGTFDEPEADKFAKVAMSLGVPSEKIFIENRATNTGENITLSYQLLQRNGMEVKRLILVQKPYMERRTYATFKKQWPGEGVEFTVTSPQVSFEKYPNKEIPLELLIHIMVGDMQRIIEYPKLGYQVQQEVPEDVQAAYGFLVAQRYTNHMID